MFDSCLSESIAGGVRGNFNDLLKSIVQQPLNEWMHNSDIDTWRCERISAAKRESIEAARH